MDLGFPSFYRLFRRSRYHPAASIDLEASKAGKEERERFAASAVAFCLRHDAEFRAHFWDRICHPQGHSEKPPLLEPKNIWLEPPAWADLSLQYTGEDDRPTWIVVEIKAGAPLKARQNPLEKAFLARSTGYGAQFLKQKMAENARRRYVVLGAGETLGISDGDSLEGIEILERSWADLLAGRPGTALIDDLVDSLGKLHIDAFMMEKAKQIEVTGGLTNVANAWEVLDAACHWLGAAPTQKQFEAYKSDDDGEVLGVYLKPTAKKVKASGLYGKICTLAKAKSHVVWFGYMAGGEGPIKKSVYFYCKDAATQEKLIGKLAEVFSQPQAGSDGEVLYVTVECPPEKATGKDLEWFVSVLTQAAKAGKSPR